MLEPQVPQQRVSRRRRHNVRRHVGTENERGIERTVEKKMKIVLRMVAHTALERLVREPANAFQLVFKEKTCVDGYDHAVQAKRVRCK